MFRTYVPVQGFDEGSFCRTVRALPWLVVAVVPVHVIHKTSEAPALFAAEDRDDNYDNADLFTSAKGNTTMVAASNDGKTKGAPRPEDDNC